MSAGKLSPEHDPRYSLTAFSALVARVSDPFSDRARELADMGMTAPEFDELSSLWMEKIASTPRAVEEFELAYIAEKERLRPRPAPSTLQDLDAARFLNPDRQAFRAEAAAVHASAPTRVSHADDSVDETLPIVRPTDPVALPFTKGNYVPLPPLQRAVAPRSSARVDPDATQGPRARHDDTLPFGKKPR